MAATARTLTIIDGSPRWDAPRIKAELSRQGKTLTGISEKHNFHRTAASKALKRPWPAVEAVIGRELGLHPRLIWPDRYDDAGRSLHTRDARAEKKAQTNTVSA